MVYQHAAQSLNLIGLDEGLIREMIASQIGGKPYFFYLGRPKNPVTCV